jgi:COMPASS component SWD3
MVVRFDKEDMMAAIACSDGIIRIYNLNTSNKLIELSTNTGNEKVACTTLRWRPSNESLGTTFNSTILVANGAGTIYQFFAKSDKRVFEFKEVDNYIFAMDYNTKGTLFATAGNDCIIRIYDE